MNNPLFAFIAQIEDIRRREAEFTKRKAVAPDADYSEFIVAGPDGAGWVDVCLVPVQMFPGICDHDDHQGNDVDVSYGISDAVQAWSDCNRAIGSIFRVDENWPLRLKDTTVPIRVHINHLPLLFRDWRADD